MKNANELCKKCKHRKFAPKDNNGRCVFKTHICNELDFSTQAPMRDNQSKNDYVINDLPW